MAKSTKSLDEQEKDLKAQLADIEKKKAQITEAKKHVIADVVWSEMQNDAVFSTSIMAKLEAKVTKNADRALFDLPKKERKTKKPDSSNDMQNG